MLDKIIYQGPFETFGGRRLQRAMGRPRDWSFTITVSARKGFYNIGQLSQATQKRWVSKIKVAITFFTKNIAPR